MRSVVGAVDDDGVLGDAQLVETVKHGADILVVVDHRVVVLGLPRPGLTAALRLGVGVKVHVGEVAPDEERRAGRVLPLDEVDGGIGDVVVDGFHPLLVQRPGVLDGLLADRTVLLVVRLCGFLSERLALQHAARQRKLVEPWELVFVRVIELLRLLFGVEVVEVAEELVEAVHGRQILVQIAEVVLAELAGRVAKRLE